MVTAQEITGRGLEARQEQQEQEAQLLLRDAKDC